MISLSERLLRGLQSHAPARGRFDMARNYKGNAGPALTRDVDGKVVPVRNPDGTIRYMTWGTAPGPGNRRRGGRNPRVQRESDAFSRFRASAESNYSQSGDVTDLFSNPGVMPDLDQIEPGSTTLPRDIEEIGGRQTPESRRQEQQLDQADREAPNARRAAADVPTVRPRGSPSYMPSGETMFNDGTIEALDGTLLEPGTDDWNELVGENITPDDVDANTPRPVREALGVDDAPGADDYFDDADDLLEDEDPPTRRRRRPSNVRETARAYWQRENPDLEWPSRSPSGRPQMFPPIQGADIAVEPTNRKWGRRAAIGGIAALGGLGLGVMLNSAIRHRKEPMGLDPGPFVDSIDEEDDFPGDDDRMDMAAGDLDDEARRIFDDILGPHPDSLQPRIDDLMRARGNPANAAQLPEIQEELAGVWVQMRKSIRNWKNLPPGLTDEDAIAMALDEAQGQVRTGAAPPRQEPPTPRERQPRAPRQQPPRPAPPPAPPSAPPTVDVPAGSGMRFRGWRPTVAVAGGMGLGYVFHEMLDRHGQRRTDMAPLDAPLLPLAGYGMMPGEWNPEKIDARMQELTQFNEQEHRGRVRRLADRLYFESIGGDPDILESDLETIATEIEDEFEELRAFGVRNPNQLNASIAAAEASGDLDEAERLRAVQAKVLGLRGEQKGLRTEIRRLRRVEANISGAQMGFFQEKAVQELLPKYNEDMELVEDMHRRMTGEYHRAHGERFRAAAPDAPIAEPAAVTDLDVQERLVDEEQQRQRGRGQERRMPEQWELQEEMDRQRTRREQRVHPPQVQPEPPRVRPEPPIIPDSPNVGPENGIADSASPRYGVEDDLAHQAEDAADSPPRKRVRVGRGKIIGGIGIGVLGLGSVMAGMLLDEQRRKREPDLQGVR